MSVYITRTNGLYGALSLTKEQVVVNILNTYGVGTMSFYHYDATNEPGVSLSARLDGIMAGLSFGDSIVMQLPTMMGFRFDNAFVDKFDIYRRNSSSKLIMYVHDDLFYDPSLQANSEWIKLINRSDVLIVNNQRTAQHLANLGISRHKYSFFMANDILSDAINQFKPKYSAKINLINASNDLISSVADAGVSTYVFGGPAVESEQVKTLAISFDDPSLSYRLAKNGGWVVIWPGSPSKQLCSTYQFGISLSAGLPVVAQEGTIEAKWAHDYHFGIVVDDMKDAVRRISEMSKHEFLNYEAKARSIGRLTSKGRFTVNAVENAVWDNQWEKES